MGLFVEDVDSVMNKRSNAFKSCSRLWLWLPSGKYQGSIRTPMDDWSKNL